MKKCEQCGRVELDDKYVVCLDCGNHLQSNEYSSEDSDDGVFAEYPTEADRCYFGIDIGRNGGTAFLLNGKSFELKMPTITVKKTNKKKSEGRTYGITSSMAAYKDPAIAPVQSNGRIFSPAVNRVAPNFQAGHADLN